MTSLQKLRLWLNQGKSVSAKDFPRGFRLSTRIFMIRKEIKANKLPLKITTTIGADRLAYYKQVKTEKK